MAEPSNILSGINNAPSGLICILRANARALLSEQIRGHCVQLSQLRAKYIIVTIDVPRDGTHNKFGCVVCDALFPLGEGRASLEYVLVRAQS